MWGFVQVCRNQQTTDEPQEERKQLEAIEHKWFCTPENCRQVTRFREAIFRIYRRQGRITQSQAIALLIAFYVGGDEGLLTLLGRESIPSLLSHQTEAKDSQSGFFDWFASLETKFGPGRPVRGDTIVLFLDAILLNFFFPNPYLQLLRDALTLRSREYRVGGTYARAHRERFEKFRRAERAVEVSCRRIWKSATGEYPPDVADDWWYPIAVEEQLITSS